MTASPLEPTRSHAMARAPGVILAVSKRYRACWMWFFSDVHPATPLFVAFLLAFGLVAEAGSLATRIAARESVRVVMDDNYPPFSFRGPDGTLKGVLVDQWALWEKKTGTRVRLDAFAWAEAQRRFSAGDYDVIDTIFESEARKVSYDFTPPYVRIDVPIFFSQELAGIRGPKDLSGFIIGVKEGDNSIDVLKSFGVTDFLIFHNYEDIVAAARDGKIKVFTVDQPPALYYLIRMGIQDRFRTTDPLYTGWFHRAVRKGDRTLLAEVQQGFEAISRHEYAAIDQRWYGAPVFAKRDLTTLAFAVAGALGLFFLLLLWVGMLRRNVRLRTSELKRLTRLYAAVTHMNQAMVRITTREALLQRICETMVEEGPFRTVWIGWNDPLTHEVRVAAQHGDDNGYLDHIKVRSDDTLLGRGPAGVAIREGRTCVANDFLEAFSAAPGQAPAARPEFAATAAIPIRRGGETCGALVVYAAERNFFGAQELELLEGAAEDVSFALAHLEMDAQRQRAEAALLEREERYRTFFDHGPDGILLLDPATARPLEFNDQVCRQLGYTREEFQALTLADIEVTDTPEDTARRIQGVLETGMADFETRQRTKQGEVRDVQVTAQLIKVGATSLYHTVWRDFTSRKAAERALLQSERFLREAQAAGGVGCFSLDINLGIWESSETFDQIFGIGADYPRDVPGWLDLVAPDTRDSHRQTLLEVIQDQGRFDLEFRTRRRQDGQERWVAGQGSVECDVHGETCRLVGTMLDITERKALEAEIRSLNQDLEKRVNDRTTLLEAANQELEAFSYSVSHDLRAPLRSIDGFSQVLLEDYQNRLDETGRHYLSRIRKGTQRMGLLIDDLLKFSKTNRSDLTLTDCDLSGLSARVAGDLAHGDPGRGGTVSIQPGLRVQADPRLMQVVLENLLGNAWKFTAKREDPCIEVGEAVSAEGERAFFIKDNGAGFDMAHAAKLFHAFQRLHAVTDFEGTGIGLAIVQRIIHRHGGRVWAQAEPGHGATFLFTLPA